MTTQTEALKLALEAAYLAGFNASGEGYNGEYPFGDKMQDPAENRVWKKDRDNYIKEALAQPERHELQAKGEHPAPCARFCEANAFQIEIRRLKAQLAQPKQEYTGAEFYSKEYWEGHDAAVRGVAMRWEQALTAPIPNSGVMNEPLESLYRRTEALRMAQPKEPEQEPVPAAMKTVIEAMQQDPDYAWGWHCNIAMSFVDAGGDHYTGNQGAARFMRTLANVEPAHELPFSPPQRTAAEGEDTRRAWVGLTLDERLELAQDVDWAAGAYCEYAEKVEAKLKEKNT